MKESTTGVLSDIEVVERLVALCCAESRAKAEMVAYLVEVEKRRIHLSLAFRSMFEFCTERLEMSPNVARHRIAAARLARTCPRVLDALMRGELSLCTLVLIKGHVTRENAEQLLEEIRGMSFREVELHLVKRAPKPDIPDAIFPIPEQGTLATSLTAEGRSGGRPAKGTAYPESRIMPLSSTRFGVQLTVGERVKDKLERARDLLRHRNPDGTLEVVLERSLDTLLEELEKEIHAKTDQPHRSRGVQPGEISAAARREVFARDGERCTFEADGRRCTARGFLEIDHIHARALGGSGEAENLRVLCRAHNRLVAEQAYGRDFIEGCIEGSRSSSARRLVAGRTGEEVLAVPPSGKSPDAALPAVASENALQAPAVPSVAAPPPPSKSTSGVIGPAHVERSTCDVDEADRARVLRGLIGLGFKRADASRVLGIVLSRDGRTGASVDLAAILREAIGLLT